LSDTSGAGSRLLHALAAAERAFAAPTLGLLHKQEAPLVVALLSAVFASDRPAVATEQLHVEVEDLCAELRAAGRDGVPAEPARVLCTRWVRERWLVRTLDDAGEERYQLSSYAAEALDFIGRTQGSRALVSESRIRTLLVALEDLASDARPDREARMRALRAQIEQASSELSRLESGGDVEAVAPERLAEQLDNLLWLVRELPTDFARVAESITTLQREIVARLRHDDRPTGVVVADYLDATDSLLERTAEGRAFLGAMELLGDPQLLASLDARVQAVLTHPFAAQLPVERRAALRALRGQVVAAIEVVLAAQARASRTVTAQIRHHNPLRDRELDHALREATAAMADWFPATPRGARVEPLRWLDRSRLGRLRDSLHDLRPETPPEALEDWADDDPAGPDLDLLRSLGGPRHGEIAAHLASLPDGATVGEAFVRGPRELRRPVELLGYLELADVDGAGDVPAESLERVAAVRADGTERVFVLPRTRIRQRTTGEDG